VCTQKGIPGKLIQPCPMLHFVVENFKSVMKIGKTRMLNYIPAYEDPLKKIVENISGFMLQKVLHHLN
jgi:hypothetical protein